MVNGSAHFYVVMYFPFFLGFQFWCFGTPSKEEEEESSLPSEQLLKGRENHSDVEQERQIAWIMDKVLHGPRHQEKNHPRVPTCAAHSFVADYEAGGPLRNRVSGSRGR